MAAKAKAQELYVYTEPASNMPAKSIGVRLDNMLMQDKLNTKTSYALSPEIMFGVSRHIMVHITGYFNSQGSSFSAKGAGLYLKYRFLSIDEVHDHFRMAAFGRFTFNNNIIKDEAIALGRNNTGYETGMIATKLINKLALSVSSSFVHAMDNGKHTFHFLSRARNAVAYSFSIGKLFLPIEYTSYKQTNMNAMLEFLGQTNFQDGNSYIDMAPSVQFIFNSQLRADLGYRFALKNKLVRNETQGALVRIEYNFFNAIK